MFPTHSMQSTQPLEVTRKAPQRPRRLGFWLRLVVGGVLLYLVLRSIDRSALWRILASVEPHWLLLLAGASVFDRVLMALKWNGLLRARGVRISAGRAIRLCYIGNLAGSFTPGAIGGEVYRVAALRPGREEAVGSPADRTEIVVASILLERAIGLAVICLFAAALLPWSAEYHGAASSRVIWAVVVGSVALVGGLAVALRPEWMHAIAPRIPFVGRTRIATKLGVVYAAFAAYRRQPGVIVRFVLLTVLEVLAAIVVNYLAARSVGVDPPFLFFLGVMPLIHILVRLPISFEGLGVQEGLFAFFLLQCGFPAEDGVAVSLLLRGLFVAMVLLPAVVLMARGERRGASGGRRDATTGPPPKG
jgi:uncharacterized protein (TIRG00374 family)